MTLAQPSRPVMNRAEVPLLGRRNAKKFAVMRARAGALLRLEGLARAVHVAPPGKRAFAFHRHHVADEVAMAAGAQNADVETATCVGTPRVMPVDYYDGEDA